MLLNTLLFSVLEKRWLKLIKLWEDWECYKSWPKYSHVCTLIDDWGGSIQDAGALHRKHPASNSDLIIDKMRASCNWHAMEWGVQYFQKLLGPNTFRILYIINETLNCLKKWNWLTWERRCFVFGILPLAHEASKYAQYNLMNLLGRPQIDYFTGAPCRKCQRQANCSTMLSWEKRYTFEHYWL